jgi:hypothetical protein
MSVAVFVAEDASRFVLAARLARDLTDASNHAATNRGNETKDGASRSMHGFKTLP